MGKILIIDDERAIRRALKEILEFEEFEVFEAENGKIGLEMAMADTYDIIFCDIKMPEMDGLEATRIIRANNKNIPIIAVTAFASNEDRHQCIKAGCDDYISKPFKTGTLFALIDKYVYKQ